MGIDIGTTSVKTVLITSSGKIIGEATEPHDLMSKHAGWAEEDANIWWDNAIKTVRTLCGQYPEETARIEAIGSSGMVPAIVMLDREGKVLRNTIQQNDARAISQIEKVTANLDQKELYKRTGGFTNQQHVIPRLLWIKENEPEIFKKTDYVMGSYDYIVYKMTNKRSIEMNWAVESGMFDIHTKQWINEHFDAFGISPSLFPAVNSSIAYVGGVSEEAARLTGLKPGIPMIAGSADHIASSLAAGIIEEGDLLIKFGGAGDILYCVDTLKTNPKLFFDYHIVPDKYLLNGCMASSGSLVKWFTNDILGYDNPDVFKKLDEEASQLTPASDGLIILPYFVGEKTPIFDPTARGVIFGLNLSHQKSAIFRAILESVIYGFQHHVDVLRESGYHPRQIFATNGGAKSNFWCQIAADVLGATIKAFPFHPGSALGVAFLTGMASGAFSEWQEIHKFLDAFRLYEPIPENQKIYKKSYKIYRNLYTRLMESFKELQSLYV